MKTTKKRKFLKEKDWEYCHNKNIDTIQELWENFKFEQELWEDFKFKAK